MTPPTTEAAIAVLFERLDHVIKAVEALSEKMEAHNEARNPEAPDYTDLGIAQTRRITCGMCLD